MRETTKKEIHMTLEDLRAHAAALFPLAVTQVLENPGAPNEHLERLNDLCWSNFETLGFCCMSDCFTAIVPKSEGRLSLTSWTTTEMKIMSWTIRLRLRAFHIGLDFAHLEIEHDGPLPGITETGYLSKFIPLETLAGVDPDDYFRRLLTEQLPAYSQMSLF
jgi:hypothetical protein